MNLYKDTIRNRLAAVPPITDNSRLGVRVSDEASGKVFRASVDGPGILGALLVGEPVPDSYFQKPDKGSPEEKSGSLLPSLMPRFAVYGFISPEQVGAFADGYAQLHTLRQDETAAAFDFGAALREKA